MTYEADDNYVKIPISRFDELTEAEQQLATLHAAVTGVRDDYAKYAKEHEHRPYREWQQEVADTLTKALDAAPATGDGAQFEAGIDHAKPGEPRYRYPIKLDPYPTPGDIYIVDSDGTYYGAIKEITDASGKPLKIEYYHEPAPPPPVPVGIDPEALRKVIEDYQDERDDEPRDTNDAHDKGWDACFDSMKRSLTALIDACGDHVPYATCDLCGASAVTIRRCKDCAGEQGPMVPLREPLRKFAEAMEAELKRNDHKGGWYKCTFPWLKGQAISNLDQAYKDFTTSGKGEKASEIYAAMDKALIDAANFIMMIYDNYHDAPHRAAPPADTEPRCYTCGDEHTITCDDYRECTNPEKCAWGKTCKDGTIPCPDCTPAAPAPPKGLYNKFTVTRNDGRSAPGEKHHDCEYFVLDLTHDKFARKAIRVYAQACIREYPELAADLREKYESADTPAPPTTSEQAAWWLAKKCGVVRDELEAMELATAIKGDYNHLVTAWLDAQADGKEVE